MKIKRIKYCENPKLYTEIIFHGKFIRQVTDENGYVVREFK